MVIQNCYKPNLEVNIENNATKQISNQKINKYLLTKLDKHTIENFDLKNVSNIPYISVGKKNIYDVMKFRFKLSVYFSDKKQNEANIYKTFTGET